MKKRYLKFLTLLTGFIFLMLAAYVGAREVWHWLLKPISGETKEMVFVIRPKEPVLEIADDLQEKGLIKNKWVFYLYLRKMGYSGRLQAGDFKLSPSLGAKIIANKLTLGTLDVWITTIEGWRKEEIGQYLENKLGVKKEDFQKMAREGYSFPDTYLIPRNASISAIVGLFQRNFNQRVNEKIRKDAQKQDLTLDELLILASIVEREVKQDTDRPIVAGILLKRLNINMPLQVDATIQYIKGGTSCTLANFECKWWPEVTKEDLKTNSVYNTYLYPGLPPAPIANPGLSSIKAVIYPQKSDFWYYLSDKKGLMHYARTMEEHLENTKKYL